jgi:uncharacterized protein YbjQ (UPF0145 family)
MAARNDVIITTADTVAGRETVEEIDIVAAECVFGMNLFRDLFASIRDVFGGRSQSYQRVFRDARDTVKSELKEQAAALGAHAVVATRFTYNQLDGTSGGMVMVAAVGTAVGWGRALNVSRNERGREDARSVRAGGGAALSRRDRLAPRSGYRARGPAPP